MFRRHVVCGPKCRAPSRKPGLISSLGQSEVQYFYGAVIRDEDVGLVRALVCQEEKNFLDTLRAICMAHDIGHPPFGHGGELALNYLMRDCGGFEGNAQNIRLLEKIENYNFI